MNKIRFIFTFVLTICLLLALSFRIQAIPAMGKLLNPFGGFYNLSENPEELHLDTDIISDHLKEEATVYFDERRIPHIFANNEQDLYFVQGYVVASLRLWQMEFQVLAAEGRIAEILGEDPKYLAFDKKQRKLGLKYGALNKLETVNNDAQSTAIMNSFNAGVNSYISSIKPKDLPLEYQLMGYQPEEWSTYKTTLLLMNMSNVLTSTEYDIENSNFITTYGQGLFDTLYSNYFESVEPVVQTPKDGWDVALFKKDSLPKISLPTNAAEIGALSSLSEKTDVQIGSNNWAVSGKKTESGYPMLANDPHLKLSFPSVWIEMHLSSPDVNTYGVVFPGAPGIIIGFNDYIGWGVTNGSRDVKDWYEIEFKDTDKDFYKWQNGWRATTKKIEEFKIKGAPSAFDTIIYTHLGPVTLENFETQAGVKNFALQWMAHKGSQEYRTFYLLNRAKNFEDYLDALRFYECPAQNFVFACIDGDIAIRQQGKFPILEDKQGQTYQDGSQMEAWTDFIPFDENPMMYNPERAFVASANQNAVDTTYPYYTNGVYEYYRNRVINKELRKIHKATFEDFKALQFNNYNLMAEEYLPIFLSYINENGLSDEAKQLYLALKNWNFENTKDSKASIYFQILQESYYTLLWDEFVEKEVLGGWDPYTWKAGWKAPNEYQTFRLLADTISHPFIDNLTTVEVESTRDLIELAFGELSEKIINKDTLNWGQYKNTSIEHLAMIPAFSSNIEISGNYKIVNATGKFHGPSWRMILDFKDGKIKGYGTYPGGQSGNPGSKYYDNMVNEWSNGIYHDLNYNKDKATFENENYLKVNFKKN